MPSSPRRAGDGLKPNGIGETPVGDRSQNHRAGIGAARLCNLVDERRPPLVPIEDFEARA
jgi:hypothetical protein